MKQFWIGIKLRYMRVKINWLIRREAQEDMKDF